MSDIADDLEWHLKVILCSAVTVETERWLRSRDRLIRNQPDNILEMVFVSDIAIFVLKKDVKLQLTN